MRTFNKKPLALGVAAGMAMLVASTGAMAISTGTDLNLSAKARAGGMAGAAYTMPQEASAAVFGNPATMTQFKGINLNFGASFLGLPGVDVETSSSLGSTKSHSDADDYIVPDFGLTLQVSPNLVLGTGLEVDAGLGADYRDDPASLLGAGLVNLPLNVELISFNANLAAAYQATEKLSVGGAITVGFALAQLGTTGPTSGVSAALGSDAGVGPGLSGYGADVGINDFGGTTSSVHDIGFSGTLGATYQLQEGVMLSAAYKTKHEYNFTNILHGDLSLNAAPLTGPNAGSAADYQDLSIAQPAEVILGVALDNVIADGLLVEADVIWKNWSDAATYEDAFEDQYLFVLGAQYETGDWSLRAGYSYATDILRSSPGCTLDSLTAIGTLPTCGVLGNDLVKVAQATLLPTIWNHTITAGVGYAITDAVSIDAYAAYAFGEDETTSLDNVTAVVSSLANLGAVADVKMESQIDYEFMIGAGINIALP